MSTRNVFLAVLVSLILVFFYSSSLKATNGNGCVNCHTDGDLLKKLVKIPALGGGEGEG